MHQVVPQWTKWNTDLCSDEMNVCSVCSFKAYVGEKKAARILGGSLDGVFLAILAPINVGQHCRLRPVEASMSRTNEWDVLKRQFDVLVRGESLGAESIDEILDVQFRRRFAELIDQTAQRNSTTGYIDWSRR
jgi:hypothetical protein